MKKMCDLLRNFRSYNALIDKFIEESQNQILSDKNIISEIEKMCLSTSDIVLQVCGLYLCCAVSTSHPYSNVSMSIVRCNS